jgi:RimJ/RimL family protein N-acetyltransferase
VADSEVRIPSETLEAIARSLFKSTAEYGFRQVDYLRFVNLILDMSMKNGIGATKAAVVPAPRQFEPLGPMPLRGEGIGIRSFDDAGDRGRIEKWVADRRGRYFLLSRATAEPLEIAHLLASERNVLGVITLNDGQPIGLMAFLDHDQAHRKAELRKLIGESAHRGKGYGKQATELWIRHGIANLALRKIYLNTVETDLRNIRLNEELGFKVEGILRNECWFDGEYHDILRMALLVE